MDKLHSKFKNYLKKEKLDENDVIENKEGIQKNKE
jgi:hypothetical protein